MVGQFKKAYLQKPTKIRHFLTPVRIIVPCCDQVYFKLDSTLLNELPRSIFLQNLVKMECTSNDKVTRIISINIVYPSMSSLFMEQMFSNW